MLEMRPNCECCDNDLPAHTGGAFICTFECTFCADCTENKLDYFCPNCGGDLVTRPKRSLKALRQYPASTKRILKEKGC